MTSRSTRRPHRSLPGMFTDPPYGLEKNADDPAKQAPYQGVYKISGGKVTLLTATITRPNGIAFFPGQKSLLIANFVLFAAALGLTLIPSGKRAGVGAALWVGVISAVVLVWVATARLRQDSNMWPIDFVILAFMTGVPMLVGRTVGLVYWRIRIGQRLNPWLVAAAILALVIVAWFALLF